MIQPNTYVTLRGDVFALVDLDVEEREFVDDLTERAGANPDWNDFDNYWTSRIGPFYSARGTDRKQVPKTVVWKIAQDLSGRIGIAAGLVRMPDYRDELEFLIRREFKSRREFCEKTGIKEDMLSHVLARRKHLSIDTLSEGLSRIGHALRIVPLETSPSQD